MKKKYRVKKSSEFKKILDRQLVLGKNSSFNVYYLKNSLGFGRVGIAVSKKNGNAVVRSRIRRQVRAMVNALNIISYSYDFIIIIKQAYNNLTFDENLNSLKSIFEKIKETK